MKKQDDTKPGIAIPPWLKSEFDEIVSILTKEDELGCVIRAHIQIEQLLQRALDRWIPNPEYLDKLRTDYDGLVTLALMHGMDKSYGPPFRTIGNLRNDFAHKPNTSLTKQSVGNLYKCLGPKEKNAVQGIFELIRQNFHIDEAVGRFADLSPFARFQLIAITLWTVARKMAMTTLEDAEQSGPVS